MVVRHDAVEDAVICDSSSLSDNSAAFMACSPAIARYIRRRVQSAEEAADVFQELSLLLLRVTGAPDDHQGFVRWCKGLARNLLAHHYRAKQRRAALLDRVEVEAADLTMASAPCDPEQQACARQRLAWLLAGFDEPLRQLVVERYLLGCSAQEIAARSTRSPTAVRMRLMRARVALLRVELPPRP